MLAGAVAVVLPGLVLAAEVGPAGLEVALLPLPGAAGPAGGAVGSGVHAPQTSARNRIRPPTARRSA